jgi:hypothetical protein
VGTPAIDSNIVHDVYLTIDSLPAASGGPVGIGVIVQPLVVWLWVGGAILVFGSLLALVPGRRRRPTDPVSAPIPALADNPVGRSRRVTAAAPVERLVPVPSGGPDDGRSDDDRVDDGGAVAEESPDERVPAGSP